MISKLSVFLALATAQELTPQANTPVTVDLTPPTNNVLDKQDATSTTAAAAGGPTTTTAAAAGGPTTTTAAAAGDPTAPTATTAPAGDSSVSTMRDTKACPAPEAGETNAKYQCKYNLDDAVALYIGRDEEHVHMKATTTDARWVAVGPSQGGMMNLSAVINHGEATTEGNGGPRFIAGMQAAHESPEPTGDKAFAGTPTFTKEDGKRTIELMFDVTLWNSDEYNSGASIAWGKDPDAKFGYHGTENRKFILFDGSDSMYKLPGTSPSVDSDDDGEDDVVEVDDGASIAVAKGDDESSIVEAKGESGATSFCALSAFFLLPALV